MIEAVERRRVADDDENDERRRYYRIRPFGRDVLRAEAVRMRALVVATEARISLPAEGS
jgi:hypothetical protein